MSFWRKQDMSRFSYTTTCPRWWWRNVWPHSLYSFNSGWLYSVHTCVCAFVCMYACMHVCMHTSVSACTVKHYCKLYSCIYHWCRTAQRWPHSICCSVDFVHRARWWMERSQSGRYSFCEWCTTIQYLSITAILKWCLVSPHWTKAVYRVHSVYMWLWES